MEQTKASMQVQEISVFGLLYGLVFVGTAGIVSLLLQLDLERRILWATVRAAVQLGLIGQALAFILSGDHGLLTACAMTLMVCAAAFEAIRRPDRKLAGTTFGAFITLLLVGFLTSLYVAKVVIGLEPWSQPRYLIPLLGMILGNALTGLSLCIEHLLETVDLRRNEIEADLACGATRFEAMRDPLREAVRKGATPILNATSVVGLVSLPGMMTGQILSGTEPSIAVRYQFVVMIMILGSTAVATLALSIGIMFRVTDREHRLRTERIRRSG